MATSAILIVGDEILGGHTQDTNSHYLAQRLARRGIRLGRIVTCSDDVDDIATQLERLVADAPDFIFVCGGIGPTPDDRTYEGVAMTVGAPLAVAPADEAWIRRRFAERHPDQPWPEEASRQEAMLRMVRRPEGSEVLANPVGAALGSAVRVGPTTVFVVPGVPREMQAMVERSVEPLFLAGHERSDVTGELEVFTEEARLYGVMRELEARHPDLKLGSYPQDDKGRVILRAQGRPAEVEAALARLNEAVGGRGRRRDATNKP